MTVYIYVLKCPSTGQVRYVGKTQSMSARRRQHLYEARSSDSRSHKVNWLRSLLRRGQSPIMEIDTVVEDDSCWKQVEVERIAHYRRMGCDLTNSTDGGDTPAPLTEEGMRVLSQRASAMFGSEEGRRIQSHRMKELCKDHAFVQARARASKEARSKESYRKAQSERSKKQWKDPSYRDRVTKARQALSKNPDFIRKLSESVAASQSDPEIREAISMKVKERWKDPKYKEYMKERMKAAAALRAGRTLCAQGSP